MPIQINVFNIKTNAVSQNGNIDFGTIVQNSHTANMKMVGGNCSLGDLSPSSALMFNAGVDPDVSDQGQTANLSPIGANQF